MSQKGYRLSKLSLLLSNLFDHYDSALFGLLSPFIAPLFFPTFDFLTALILTYCMIPLGMITRPLGSIVFGYIGDNQGRKEALVLSLTGMAMVTAFMGFIPTYDKVGIFAPIFLSIGRILQSFFAAGETAGGAIYLMENTQESKKDLMSSFYGASTVGGVLLASLGVSILCSINRVQEYWRFLYFLGFITVFFAALLRINTTLVNSPPKVLVTSSLQFVLQAFWKEKQSLIAIAFASGFSYASYTLSLVMMNVFVPLVSSVSNEEMMHLNTFLLLIDFFLLPVFGILAQHFSREKMMILSGLLATFSGLPLFWFLQDASFFSVILIRFTLVIIGVWFSAPFYAWAHNLIAPSHRYTVISFAYAIGSQVIGGSTVVISLWLFQQTNWIVSAAWYWMLLGLVTSYLMAKRQSSFKEERRLDLSFQHIKPTWIENL